jgi:hypothetical protein
MGMEFANMGARAVGASSRTGDKVGPGGEKCEQESVSFAVVSPESVLSPACLPPLGDGVLVRCTESTILILGNSLSLHLVMLALQLVSFEENNEPRIYVPKSQRGKLWTLLLPIKAWTNDMAKTIESAINNWTSSARARSRMA